MNESLKIVVIEDDDGLNELIKRRLQREKHDPIGFTRANKAVEWLRNNDADLILLDLMLPDYSGEEIIDLLVQHNIKVPFIIATGQGSEAVAVKMLKKGAKDYLVKNSEFLNVLPATIESVWHEFQLQRLLEKAREQIRSQNAILSAVHQLSPDGILVIDADKKVVSYNPQLLDNLNIDKSEMPEDVDRFFSLTAEKVEDGETFIDKNLNMDDAFSGLLLDEIKVGNRYFELYSMPMEEHGQMIGGRVWYFRDITLHKEAQLERERARLEAEHNVKVRSQFFAIVTHDVKTPLNSISGFLGLLENSELNDEQRKYTEIIKSSSEHLLMLINDILDLTKIERGAFEFNPAVVDVRDLIRVCINIFLPSSKEAGIELNFDVDDDVPENIVADFVRLKQVIINIISNAVKFTHKGQVDIRCRRKDDTYLEFEISDTGAGIPEDVQEAIFTPFTQANSEVHAKYGGSGLGLAISKQLVERCTGEIQLESKVGEGSTFTFTVPVDLTQVLDLKL